MTTKQKQTVERIKNKINIFFSLKDRQLIYRGLLDRRDTLKAASENNLLPTQLRLIAKLEEKQITLLLRKIKL